MNGEAIGRYLNALRETKGLERKAATMAGIPFAEIRKEREISDEFREMEQDVRANIVEEIRAEVIRRGVDGVDKSVYYKGEVVGVEKQYRDSLLLALAKANGVSLLFEASVGGGIPVLHPLSQCLGANEIYEVRGILNGTTNFILTQMLEHGQSYEAALRDAQTRGYAEQDPTADVEGIDAGRKICILADMLFGRNVAPSRISMTGISAITAVDAAFDEASGMKLRLLGRAVRQGQALTVFVSPHFIAGTQPLAPISGVLNAVEVLGSSVGAVMFSGPGAGGPATASAVLGDVIDIVRNPGRSQPVSWPAEPAALCDPEEFESPFFFRTRLPKEACEQALGPVRWLPDAGAFHGGFTQKTTRRALRASGLALDAVWPLLA